MENTEKLLIFFDEKAAKEQIEALRSLVKSVQELKMAYESLQLADPFSQSVFVALVEVGTIWLLETFRKSLQGWLKKSQAPATVYIGVDFKPNFKEIETPLQKIKLGLITAHLTPYDLKFEGSDPVFSKKDEEEIFERFRFYAITPEEIEFYKLVQDYCIASNALDSYARSLGEEGHHEIVFVSNQFYIEFEESGESVILRPYPGMFKELRERRERRIRLNR